VCQAIYIRTYIYIYRDLSIRLSHGLAAGAVCTKPYISVQTYKYIYIESIYPAGLLPGCRRGVCQAINIRTYVRLYLYRVYLSHWLAAWLPARCVPGHIHPYIHTLASISIYLSDWPKAWLPARCVPGHIYPYIHLYRYRSIYPTGLAAWLPARCVPGHTYPYIRTLIYIEIIYPTGLRPDCWRG